MTTWLTLSASCVRSRHHTATKNNPPNVRRPRISIFRAMMPRQKPCCCIDATPIWISATTYQSKHCHPMRSCFLLFPEFFFKFPFLSYLAQLPSTKSSSKLSSTLWHSSEFRHFIWSLTSEQSGNTNCKLDSQHVSKVFQNSWILVVSQKSIKPSRVFSAASSWSCSPQ